MDAARDEELSGDPARLRLDQDLRAAARSWIASHVGRSEVSAWHAHVTAVAARSAELNKFQASLKRFADKVGEAAKTDCIRARKKVLFPEEPQTFQQRLAQETTDALLFPPSTSESAEEFRDLLREWSAHARLVRRGVRPFYNSGQVVAGCLLVPISFAVWMTVEVALRVRRLMRVVTTRLRR